MEVVKIILTVIQVLFSVGLVLIVLMQSGKEAGLSGAVAGNSESFMNKGKGSARWDKKLASYTKWIALVWIVLTLILNLL